MRKLLVSVAALGVLLGACAKSSNAGGTTTGTTSGATPSANACAKGQLHLVKAGELTVGTDNPAYPPWFSGGTAKGSSWKVDDPNNGKGLESAVTYEVAKRLGFSRGEVHWLVAPFDQTYAPGPKRYDFAIEQISYSAKRAEAVTFSESYYDVNQALVAVKGTPISKAKSVA